MFNGGKVKPVQFCCLFSTAAKCCLLTFGTWWQKSDAKDGFQKEQVFASKLFGFKKLWLYNVKSQTELVIYRYFLVLTLSLYL